MTGPNWYDVLNVIDEGGQATVRLLRKRGTGELFAGKFLREHWDEVARAGFRSEGLRQARLMGPGIVRVYDYNFDAPSPFIVLEYMPRGSLAKELSSRGKVPLLEALRTVQEIASLLSHLHAKNVVHRDLKPGNVLRGKDGRLLLNDFGLGATMSLGEFVTAAGFVGTPPYAAPEQRANLAMPTSDVYALGVMLVEMLTGSRVLAGSRPPLDAVDLITHFTQADPSKRPSAYDAYHLLAAKIHRVEAVQQKRRQAMSEAVGQLAVLGLAVGVLYAVSR